MSHHIPTPIGPTWDRIKTRYILPDPIIINEFSSKVVLPIGWDIFKITTKINSIGIIDFLWDIFKITTKINNTNIIDYFIFDNIGIQVGYIKYEDFSNKKGTIIFQDNRINELIPIKDKEKNELKTD